MNLYKLGDKFQVNEQPKIKIKLFKKIWGQIKTIIDEYLQDAVAIDEIDAFETLASINDSIETYMPTVNGSHDYFWSSIEMQFRCKSFDFSKRCIYLVRMVSEFHPCF